MRRMSKFGLGPAHHRVTAERLEEILAEDERRRREREADVLGVNRPAIVGSDMAKKKRPGKKKPKAPADRVGFLKKMVTK